MDQNTKDVLLLLLPIISTGVSGYLAVRVAELHDNVKRVGTDVKKVEDATNSHTDLLVEATRLAAFAAGKEAERERVRQEALRRDGPPQ